jgi:hypothetical protein
MNKTSTDASKYDEFEKDDIDMSRLVVETRLTERMRDSIHTCFDHDPSFYDYPGPVIFMMALDIYNASQSYDIEGAQKKLDELKLESYPGEDVTICTAYAQKQFKVLQSGYAPIFRSGSKLLLKFCNTECEQFHQKIYAKLDLVKAFENKFKLADPKSITIAAGYCTLGPIALLAWLQQEHIELVTDHEWPALATKLPQSNNVMPSNGNIKREETRTCYKCHTVGHIAPNCPQKSDESNSSTRKTTSKASDGDSVPREWKKLASWKYVEPKDVTKMHIDDNDKEWKCCTHCICKATGNKGIYQLSHLDSEHNNDKVSKKAEANLTRVEDDDPSAYIPHGPPAVTTREPTVDASNDDDIVFTGAWFTPVE